MTSKITRRFWTPEEDRVLKKYHQTKTAEEMALMLNRPKGGVHARMKRLGLSGIRKGQYHQAAKWSDLQALAISMLYDGGLTLNEIDALFPDIPIGTINDITAARTRR